MTTLDAPQLNQPSTDAGSTGLTGWLDQNKWWILGTFVLIAIGYILYLFLQDKSATKRLQRDAIERLRQSLLQSCRASRGPAKTVWTSGSPRDPSSRLGRYKGHHRTLECVWLAYKPGLFTKTRVVCVNPVDINTLDVADIYVRGIGVDHARDLGFAVVNVHDPNQREEWQASTRARLSSSEAFAAEVRRYYARAVDNAIAFYDAMNASEDRSFLRQEVTRSQDELTETISIPAQPTPPPEEPQNT